MGTHTVACRGSMAFFFFLHTHVTHSTTLLSLSPPALLFGLLGQPLREPRDGVGGLLLGR